MSTIQFDITMHYIYIYAFSRRFYPKRLTLHSSYIALRIKSKLNIISKHTSKYKVIKGVKDVLSCSENITDCLHQFRIIKVIQVHLTAATIELQDKQKQSARESPSAREFRASNKKKYLAEVRYPSHNI